MPDDVGEMFYTGAMPWHHKGLALARPATLDQALKAGGLDWRVGEVDMLTADDPASPVPTRKAIGRLDRPPGITRAFLASPIAASGQFKIATALSFSMRYSGMVPPFT